MISLTDCIGLCGLTEEEVFAIAEHEHIPLIAAAALAQHLLHCSGGCDTICKMIVEDIDWASERGDQPHYDELRITLHRFVGRYPEQFGDISLRG